MKKRILIIILLILNLLIIKTEIMDCGDEQIKNCKKCGENENSDKCEECVDNNFPLLENLLCFPCDDPIYGQIGCKGNCDASDYSDSGFVYCDECKEGFYNVEGLCFICSTNSPGCTECTYEKQAETENKRFKCTKCSSNEYRINDEFYCQKCSISNCLSCHYVDEGLDSECDICMSGYYLNSNKQCSKCIEKTIDGGKCTVCSSEENDLEKTECYCYSEYAKVDKYSCMQCPDHCYKCEYDSEKEETKCLGCYSGYRLDLENKCVKCSEGCEECYLDENKNSVCLRCFSGKLSPYDKNKCFICPENCQECDFDSTKQEAICTQCLYNYVLNPLDGQCVNCNDYSITRLNGCSSCNYNTTSKSYECKYCTYYDNYAYIINTYECLSNTDSSIKGLYGCHNAKLIKDQETYECLSCKDKFISVISDKSCLSLGSEGLSIQCLEAEIIGDKYSCTKCTNGYILVNNIDEGIKNCYEKSGDFSFCSEGKIESGVNICTKCVENANLNSNHCSCNSDSFSKNTYSCYKCTDEKQGNPGCEASEGCTYVVSNDQLNCNKCKDGYFEFTEGQCFLCSNELSNCDKCHYDSNKNKLICDNCLNDIYSLNSDNQCKLNDCNEYPDISPGCIICKDKLNDYLKNNKCQTCKYGYFKTKDEKCIYCKSELYGGPACFECGYKENENGEETDNIICKKCYSNPYSYYMYNEYYYYDDDYYYGIQPLINSNYEPLISSDGKCYDCHMEFSELCDKCEFVKNNDGKENLKCVMCNPNYYLTPEGNCGNYTGLIEKTENCVSYNFIIADMNLTLSYDYIDFYDYDYYYHEPGISNFTGINYNDIKGSIKSTCISCDYGYLLNDKGECEKLTIELCTFVSIMKRGENLRQACRDFCYWYDGKTLIYLKFDESSRELSLDNLDNYNLDYLINQFGESNSPKVCLQTTGKGSENSPKNLINCRIAYFFPSNNSYLCIECYYDYFLDDVSKKCQKKENNKNDDYYYDNDDYYLNCKIENNSTDEFPMYYCYNYKENSLDYFTLITNENGEYEYKKAVGELEGCSRANENTTYINSIYNCTNCYLGYVPYYSKFYKRVICQNMKSSIIRNKQIDLDAYNDIKEKMSAINGTCEKDYFFTPDGQNCYKCDVDKGMPGCKGACNFSLKRNNIIECTGECKSGYIESSKGVCSPCSSINPGCHECHYESDYPIDYKGIKRKRNFVCDFCEDGYSKSSSGKCLNCEDLGLYECNRCELDPKNGNEPKCTQCKENYFLDEVGECDYCDKNEFKPFNKNECIKCNNASEGGIPNCHYCESDGQKVTCNKCYEGSILLTNNNSCLEIMKNKELEKFPKCDSLTLEQNNKLVCSKCKEYYSLLNKECIYLPTLYDYLFEPFYQSHYIDINGRNTTTQDYIKFTKNDYIYQKYKNFYSCQEAENKGTEDNPLYSCKKCPNKEKKKKVT